METTAHTENWGIVSEIELIYKSKVKASQRPSITSSGSAFELALANWNDNKIELIKQFRIILLSQCNKVPGIYEMSAAGVSGTVVDIRILFSAALKAAATAIILIHNHPSGRTIPSEADRHITSKIVQAGKILDINVLGHMIISSESYYSFADKGTL